MAAYASLWIVDDKLRINDIAVDPRVRRRRIGTRLLEWILSEAARRGCRRAVLEVRPSNEAARRLYARFGFRQTGVPYVRPERMFGVTTNSLRKNLAWARKGIFSFSFVPLEQM